MGPVHGGQEGGGEDRDGHDVHVEGDDGLHEVQHALGGGVVQGGVVQRVGDLVDDHGAVRDVNGP